MSLAVLTDEQIAALLDDLTLDEAEGFRRALTTTLHEYSTGTQTAGVDDVQQPPRTSVASALTGATTLFVPSWSQQGVGMKVLTLSPPQRADAHDEPTIRPTGAITLYSPTGDPIGILHASTLTAFRTALSSACLLVKRDTVKSITVFGSGEQAYWHVRLALLFRGATIRKVNVVCRRFSDSTQHMMKRFLGMPQHRKDREGWAEAQFSLLAPTYNEYARLLSNHLRSADVIYCCTPSTEPLFDHTILTSHEGRRKGRLIVAIGSFKHNVRELPTELLRQATKVSEKNHFHYHKHAVEGGVVVVDSLDSALKESGEIKDAGLTPRQLVELGELVMLSQKVLPDDDDISSDGTSTPSNVSAPSLDLEKLDLSSQSSALATALRKDSRAGSLSRHSSPSSPSRKSFSGTPSTSNMSSLKSLHQRSSSQVSVDRRKNKKQDDHLARWLQRGNVIYKSVGLGLMDLSVGLHLIEFARKKGVGCYIEGF